MFRIEPPLRWYILNGMIPTASEMMFFARYAVAMHCAEKTETTSPDFVR